MRDINYIVIHCSDTPNGVSYTARNIDSWHAQRNFRREEEHLRISQSPWFPYIGYHEVIEIDGLIEAGRDWPEIGAHCKECNYFSLGVCMVGINAFTLSQWNSLSAVVNKMLDRFSPCKVVGHYQFNKQKSCPGFSVPDWLDNQMKPLNGHIIQRS